MIDSGAHARWTNRRRKVRGVIDVDQRCIACSAKLPKGELFYCSDLCKRQSRTVTVVEEDDQLSLFE